MFSGTEKQPKHKVFGWDIPGTSGTQMSGYPGQNFMQVAFFCCFRQGMAGMSRDLGRDVPDLEKLYARKLWADFSLPMFFCRQPELKREVHRVHAKGVELSERACFCLLSTF